MSEDLVLAGLLSATLSDDFGVGFGMVVSISEDLVLAELLSVTLFDDLGDGLKVVRPHLVRWLGIDLSIYCPVHLSEDLVLAELFSVTLSDDSVWMYVPSVVYPNDLR